MDKVDAFLMYAHTGVKYWLKNPVQTDRFAVVITEDAFDWMVASKVCLALKRWKTFLQKLIT